MNERAGGGSTPRSDRDAVPDPVPGSPARPRSEGAASGSAPVLPAPGEPGLPVVLAQYVLARLGLLALLAGLLVLAGAPVVVALLVALVVALPLSMLLFRGLRARLDAALAAAAARRRIERDALRARLRGDLGDDGAGPVDAGRAGPSGSGQPGEGQPGGDDR